MTEWHSQNSFPRKLLNFKIRMHFFFRSTRFDFTSLFHPLFAISLVANPATTGCRFYRRLNKCVYIFIIGFSILIATHERIRAVMGLKTTKKNFPKKRGCKILFNTQSKLYDSSIVWRKCNRFHLSDEADSKRVLLFVLRTLRNSSC